MFIESKPNYLKEIITAALQDDVNAVKKYIMKDPDSAKARDENGNNLLAIAYETSGTLDDLAIANGKPLDKAPEKSQLLQWFESDKMKSLAAKLMKNGLVVHTRFFEMKPKKKSLCDSVTECLTNLFSCNSK